MENNIIKNMNKEELISKKVRGFKFKGEIGRIMFNSSMKDTIGEVGTIIEYDKKFNTFQVNFRNSSWFYPAELIEQHLVEEEPTKRKVVCTNNICQGECGECKYMEIVSNTEPTQNINYNKIISNKEILNKRIEKTKNTLAYSAALYQDEVILSNQIAIMEALIAIQDILINKVSQSDRVNEKENNK